MSELRISTLINIKFLKTIGISFYSKQFCNGKEGVTKHLQKTADGVKSYEWEAVNHFKSVISTLHLLNEQHQDDN